MNATVIASLIGVIVGASGSIVAQFLVIRYGARSESARRHDERIEYRRQLVREFLEECQAAEARAIYRYQRGEPPGGASSDKLWYLQKYLNLIIPSIESKTQDYASCLDSLLWNGVTTDHKNVWDAMAQPRTEFLTAVRPFVRQ